MRFIKHLPNNFIFLCIIIITVIKLMSFILVKNDVFQVSSGGGSDADYYHNYVIGYTDNAVNIWPVILRYLNNFGLYSRNMISFLLFLLHLFVIPILACKLADLKFKSNQKIYLYLYSICLIYPTLFFYTFDIYRDIFMVFSFLIGGLSVKNMTLARTLPSFFFYLIISILMGLFLLALRPYLGYAFMLSLLLWNIRFTKKRIIILLVLYLLILFIANYVGLFESLTEYRSGFEELESGSTLGLDFSNPVMFVPNFILSFLGQMLGLYITNPLAIILLLIETVPLLFMIIYIIKNIKLADKFVRFLIVFFILYASVWLIGNDNLGTAIRLRIYNYFAIYISFFYILSLKVKFLNKI